MSSELTVFQPNERDSFGQYQILAGHVHSFAFQVPMFGSLQLTIAHILPNSQDFSLDFWITETPLDGLLLSRGFGHHKANRRADKFEIFSSFLKKDDTDTRLFLDTHQPYFINVKNLQNRKNAYQLDFEAIPTITP